MHDHEIGQKVRSALIDAPAQQARRERYGMSRRHSDSVSKELFYVAGALPDGSMNKPSVRQVEILMAWRSMWSPY